jgi:inorganic pyrophosphatase
VGLFWIITGHSREGKLVCVPDGDFSYRGVTELAELPEHQRLEIAHFFDIYGDVRSRDGCAVRRTS